MLKFLLAAGATEALWAASLAFRPWADNVPVFLAVAGGAFALYAWSWHFLKSRREKKRFLLPLILLAGIAFRLTVFLAPPSLSDDIYRYLWDGRVQAAGLNPYFYAPDDPALEFLRDENHAGINHKPIRTIYPPLAQAAFRSAAAVSPALSAQRLLFLAFDMALMVLLVFYLRLKKLPPENVLLYAWNPLVLVEFSSSGHMDSLGMFFLMAGLFAWEAGRRGGAGILWGLCFLGKFASLLLVPWMVLRRGGLRAFSAFLLTVAAGYAAYLRWPLGEVTAGLFSGAAVYAKNWYFNAGLYALLSEITPFSGASLKIALFGGAAALGLVLARRLPEDGIAAYAGILWAACLAASPVVHPWYAAWLAPFLCLYPVRAGLLFTGLALSSYLVLPEYRATGLWRLPAWVPWLEWGAPFALLVYDGIWKKRRSVQAPARPAAPSVPLRPWVIIPALNEEKALPLVLAEIPRDKAAGVIVVDNGSTDGTAEAARAGGAGVVRENRRGYGRAVLTGLSRLPPECDTVVVMDGDHSDYPEDLGRLLAPLERGEADFVIGSRVLGGAPAGSLTPQQRFGNWLSCFLLWIFFGRKFTDLGPFRAIRRRTLDSLRMEDDGFGWNVEMQIKAVRDGVPTVEVPVRYRPRIGVSKISGTLKGTLLAGTVILWTLFRHGLWERKK
ncbi:MAG: glycosyltransferase [Elusimicrobiota bacterium]